MKITGKDLTQQAPTSPRTPIKNYVILLRLADKARAEFLGGKIGEYHTDCPLDHMLLDWKGLTYEELKQKIIEGIDNEGLAEYVDSHGHPKTKAEVIAWSEKLTKANPYHDPAKKEWYSSEVEKLGLDPKHTTLFDWLEADDQHSFRKVAA